MNFSCMQEQKRKNCVESSKPELRQFILMRLPKDQKSLNIFAIILLVLVSLNMVMHIVYYHNEIEEIIWYCNSTAILLAIALLMRRQNVICAVLVTAIPAQFLWGVDMFLYILNQLFGTSQLGRTLILFEESDDPIVLAISIILHFALIPIAFYAVYSNGFSKNSLAYSILWGPLLIIVAYLFTPPSSNINCAFHPCDLLDYREIRANPFYGSVAYAVQEIIIWMVICALSYLCFRFIFQKLNKLQ